MHNQPDMVSPSMLHPELQLPVLCCVRKKSEFIQPFVEHTGNCFISFIYAMSRFHYFNSRFLGIQDYRIDLFLFLGEFARNRDSSADVGCIVLVFSSNVEHHHVARLGGPVQRIDGEMVSWYGSRAILALRYLDGLRA